MTEDFEKEHVEPSDSSSAENEEPIIDSEHEPIQKSESDKTDREAQKEVSQTQEDLNKEYDTVLDQEFKLDSPELDTSNNIPEIYDPGKSFWGAPVATLKGIWHRMLAPYTWEKRMPIDKYTAPVKITRKDGTTYRVNEEKQMPKNKYDSWAKKYDTFKKSRKETVEQRGWAEDVVGAKWYSLPVVIANFTSSARGFWYLLTSPDYIVKHNLLPSEHASLKELAEHVEWKKTRDRNPSLKSSLEKIGEKSVKEYSERHKEGLKGVKKYDVEQAKIKAKKAEEKKKYADFAQAYQAYYTPQAQRTERQQWLVDDLDVETTDQLEKLLEVQVWEPKGKVERYQFINRSVGKKYVISIITIKGLLSGSVSMDNLIEDILTFYGYGPEKAAYRNEINIARHVIANGINKMIDHWRKVRPKETGTSAKKTETEKIPIKKIDWSKFLDVRDDLIKVMGIDNIQPAVLDGLKGMEKQLDDISKSSELKELETGDDEDINQQKEMQNTLSLEFLNVYNSLLQAINEDIISLNVQEDLQVIEKKFDEIFKSEGLEILSVEAGEKFDRNTMKADTYEEHEKYKEDAVIGQFEAGLKNADGKILKYSLVRVSSGAKKTRDSSLLNKPKGPTEVGEDTGEIGDSNGVPNGK